MAYPRRCAGCGRSYASWDSVLGFAHVTLAARDGGTPSPWVPDAPGRLLDLGCRLCGAVVRWDYFGRAADGRLGRPVALLRPPVAGWQPGELFFPQVSERAGGRRGRRAQPVARATRAMSSSTSNGLAITSAAYQRSALERLST